jgi:tryptophanyl-tRNA synthetase
MPTLPDASAFVPPATPRTRVLSGMRPTGALHLGHYHGALKNWVKLQDQHDCFFFVADWHALTTEPNRHQTLEHHVYDMVVDWLAAGVDPDRATLFIQSRLPEHAELFTLLAMHTPLPWLERTPSYKDRVAKLPEGESPTLGFLGYPLLQAADILIYRANHVPVGDDQAPHIEITREVARRFNHLHGTGRATPVLTEPQVMLSDTSRLPGLDGEKMSKSLGNTIAMRDSPDAVTRKVRRMPTDPQRVHRDDTGDPARCPVWPLHQVYTDESTRQRLAQGCRSAGIGCLDCKQPLIEAIVREQQPWHERAQAVLAHPKQVQWMVELGTERARTVARQTMKDVREAMGLNY